MHQEANLVVSLATFLKASLFLSWRQSLQNLQKQFGEFKLVHMVDIVC